MDNNKKHAADMHTNNTNKNKNDNRTEFADDMNAKDTQAKNNKQNTK